MRKRDFLAAGIGVGAGLGLAEGVALAQNAAPASRPAPENGRPVSTGVQPSSADPAYKPRRLNKAIELWEDGQPVYLGGIQFTPGMDAYAYGVRMAKTYYDILSVQFEHRPVDLIALSEFLRGVVAGGPTRSGHRMPCVIVTIPQIGFSEDYALANSWHIGQFLDCGVMGIDICHARDPKAIEVFAHMSCRYPWDVPGVPKLARRGLRGNPDGALPATEVWGLPFNQYIRRADLWPLNPRGELILGIKIEDTFADVTAEQTLAVPGVAFSEPGGGDHDMWLHGLGSMPENGPRREDIELIPDFVAARNRVLALSRKNKVQFLDTGITAAGPRNIITRIKEGVTLFEANEDAAIIGREYTKRKMPV